MSIMFKKNGKFTASNEIITQVDGKIVWNTCTQDFRDKMNRLNFVVCDWAQAYAKARDDIKALNATIEFQLKSPDHYDDVVEKLQKQIDDIKAKVKELDEIKKTAIEYNDADVDLFYAYRDFVNGKEDATSQNTFYRAFMEWCNLYNIVPSKSTFNFIAKCIGKKKLSATKIVKNNGEQFLGEYEGKQFLELFYYSVLDIMKKANCIKPFAFTYVSPVKDKKSK